jgi:hypothetical protein
VDEKFLVFLPTDGDDVNAWTTGTDIVKDPEVVNPQFPLGQLIQILNGSGIWLKRRPFVEFANSPGQNACPVRAAGAAILRLQNRN